MKWKRSGRGDAHNTPLHPNDLLMLQWLSRGERNWAFLSRPLAHKQPGWGDFMVYRHGRRMSPIRLLILISPLATCPCSSCLNWQVDIWNVARLLVGLKNMGPHLLSCIPMVNAIALLCFLFLLESVIIHQLRLNTRWDATQRLCYVYACLLTTWLDHCWSSASATVLFRPTDHLGKDLMLLLKSGVIFGLQILNF